ncbi:vanadium-dependent haloperoxidase [Chitinophaga rhizophila]|uniref:Vanadium-dependent haloperoxidase n=2 Tax=Chitinophaga rhizophila TaxID=2866212 RepID=A0ABS7G6S6_9BACT|nr:vanadium-dependent haloperoxidase [Chitinophaga rhizophila]MBW8683358.1 vanadium-dependent haloperoxidase [Chitinophaga rhizophila]
MTIHYVRSWCIYICMLLVIAACNKEDQALRPENALAVADPSISSNADATIPVSWYQLQFRLIKETPGFTPPVAARALAYTGIALHEAVVWGDRNGHTLSGQLNALYNVPRPERGRRYNWAIAANSALSDITIRLYPNASPANLSLIRALDSTNLSAAGNGCDAAEISRSIQFGRQVAAAIYNWSATDGGKDGYLNSFPTDYVPPVGPAFWVPTPPAFQRALLPYWGNNRLMVRPRYPETAAIPHPPFATDTASSFYKAAYKVYEAVNTLTPEENTIALYWADGGGTFTPPGHLLAITAQLITEEGLDLIGAAKLFAQVGISVNDAGIVCWKYKYRYNLLRPVTYIRQYIDAGWSSLIATPPFPSYTSGHASFTGAAGNVLAGNFGSSYTFTDNQKVPEGFAPRSFNSFQQMIDEASISRVYGGIHYDFDSEVGAETGKAVALRVLSLRY